MKISYICDVCGKPYNTEPEAKKCEAVHEEAARKRSEAARKQMEERQREAKLLEAINSAVNLYVRNHHRMPPVTLTKENEEIILDGLVRLMIGGNPVIKEGTYDLHN